MFLEDSALEFYGTARERMIIRERRASGELPPWTEDPILRDWRFGNVFREQDPGTVYVAALLDRWKDESPEDVVFSVWLYRQMNLRESWGEVAGGDIIRAVELDAPALVASMEARRKAKKSLFTSSHMTPSLRTLADAMPVVARVARPLARRLSACRGLEDAVDYLAALPGGGDFSGYMVAQDLMLGPNPIVRPVEDDWAFCGREVMAAVVALFGEKLSARDCVSALQLMRDRQDDWWGRLGAEPPQQLTVRACERWACEWVRYRKMKHEGASGTRRFLAQAPLPLDM